MAVGVVCETIGVAELWSTEEEMMDHGIMGNTGI